MDAKRFWKLIGNNRVFGYKIRTPKREIHYWILRKRHEITNIQYYGMENPISSSYELLWKELQEVDRNSGVTIQNVMRRIIENYFKILELDRKAIFSLTYSQIIPIMLFTKTL